MRRDLHAHAANALIGILLGLFALAGSSAAQSGDQRNAADLYNRAFERMRAIDNERFEQLIAYLESPDHAPTPEIRAILREAQPIIRELQQASRLGHVAWGIDATVEGPGTVLPHLATMRQGMYFMSLDAIVRMHDGDAAGAAAAMGATLRMSDHITTDSPFLISSLVGVAMFAHTSARLEAFIGEGLIPQGEARALLAEIGGLLGDDPFGFVASIDGERAGFSQWMIENFSGEGGLDRFIGQQSDMFLPGDPIRSEFDQMSQTEFDAALHGYDVALLEIQEAIAGTDDLAHARREIDRIVALCEQGVYGPFASLMMPSYDRVLETLSRVFERMERLIDGLETIAESPDGAEEMRNAALWYLRAIEMHDQLTAEDWTFLAEAGSNPAQPLDSQSAGRLAALLERGEPIVSLVLEASAIKRCNFDPESRWRVLALRAPLEHLEGMQRNAHLLRAAMIAEGDGPETDEDAPNLAGALLRMGAHISNDRRTKSIRVACDVLEMGLDARDRLEPGDPIAADSHEAGAALMQNFSITLREYPELSSGSMIRTFLSSRRVPETLTQSLIELAAASNEPRSLDLGGLTATDAAAAIRELDTIVRRAVSGTGSIPAMIEEYARTWPADLAHWLLDPLTSTLERVEKVRRRAAPRD